MVGHVDMRPGMCIQRAGASMSVCSQVYIFVCIPSLVDASTHPWQPENTLIFPTLIVKEEAERTEKVCVFVGVCGCVCLEVEAEVNERYTPPPELRRGTGKKKKFGFHEALEG